MHFTLCLPSSLPLIPLWCPTSLSLDLYPLLPSLPLHHVFCVSLCVSILLSSISSLSS